MIKIPDRYWLGYPLLEAGLPWLTPGAIQFLDTILRPDFRVLEFGCGGSTIYFAKRCQFVLSMETDQKWACEIRKKIPQCQHVFITEAPVPLDTINRTSPDYRFHLVMVDSDGKKTDRQKICHSVFRAVRKGGYFILDNYARYKTDFLDPKKWAIRCFDDPHWDGKGTLIAQKYENDRTMELQDDRLHQIRPRAHL